MVDGGDLARGGRGRLVVCKSVVDSFGKVRGVGGNDWCGVWRGRGLGGSRGGGKGGRRLLGGFGDSGFEAVLEPVELVGEGGGGGVGLGLI